MTFDPADLLDSFAPHGLEIVLVMALAAVLEATLGLGAFVPGETVVATGAVALAGHDLLLVAWLAVAVGAFVGDHVGYLVGRRAGPALARSRPVRRLGSQRWRQLTDLVRRRGFVALVLARQVPGVRTLVAAAAGASGLPYARFALADGVGALLWAGVWVLGGATLGQALLASEWSVVVVVAVACAAASVLVGRRVDRARVLVCA